MFCFFLCLAAFVFELLYICRRKGKSTTLQRLFVYLTISNVLYTGVLSLHVEHYFTYDEAVQCIVCMVIGFSDQYGGSVQLLLTLGIVMKLFHKVIAFCRPKKINKGHFSHHHLKYEALFVVVCFVLPFTVIWVPFRKNGPGGYGLDGPWCWIDSLTIVKDRCDDNNEAFLEQLLLWYVPFAAVSFVSLFCIVATIIFLVYICLHHNMKTRKNIITVLFDMFLLIPFLVVFCCVCLTEVSIVVLFQEFTYPRIDNYIPWMVYAIVTPIGGGVMSIAFFIYLVRRKNLGIHKMRDISRARTVRDSERQSVNSHTSQQERPGFLSNSHIGWGTSSGSAVIISPLLGENHQII